MTVAQFIGSIIIFAKQEKIVRNNQHFFFLFTLVPAYLSLKVLDINEKKWLFRQSFYV